jgi:hypothetical protein
MATGRATNPAIATGHSAAAERPTPPRIAAIASTEYGSTKINADRVPAVKERAFKERIRSGWAHTAQISLEHRLTVKPSPVGTEFQPRTFAPDNGEAQYFTSEPTTATLRPEVLEDFFGVQL